MSENVPRNSWHVTVVTSFRRNIAVNLVRNHHLFFQRFEGVDSQLRNCLLWFWYWGLPSDESYESYELLKAESPRPKKPSFFDPCSRKAPVFWVPWCFLGIYVATSCGHFNNFPSKSKQRFLFLAEGKDMRIRESCKGCFLPRGPHLRCWNQPFNWNGRVFFISTS